MFAILMGISLKSAAVLAAAWLGTWLLRGRSAAARRLVWTAAAAAILALPALSLALPSWRVAAPQAFGPTNVGLVFRVLAVAGAEPGASGTVDIANHSTQHSGKPVWRPDWRTGAETLWALGCAAMLLQMLVASLRLARARSHAPAFPDAGELSPLAASLGIDGPVAVLEGPPASMPMAAGVLRPAIFLPSDAIEWSEERRRMVLLHELAHVRSGDMATHLMARLALGLNWWNPLAWMAWRAFLKECERAADDLVLAAGARPSEYAGHLLEVARSLQSPNGAVWAGLAMARKAQLEGRLLAILDSRVRRGLPSGRNRLAPLFAAIAAIAVAAPFAAVQAQDQSSAGVPPELEATIRAANAQKNHEILEHAAAAYEKLRKYDVAQTLLEQALAIRGQVSGDRSAAYAAGLVKLGDLELRRNQRQEALSFYTKAVSLGDRPEVAGALVQMGIALMSREGPLQHWLRDTLGIAGTDASVAREYFQRAVNVDPTGLQAGPALTWMAEMRRAEPDGATEAESLYQRALAGEAPQSSAAANTMHLYARFLKQQDRPGESDEMEKQARSITQAAATEYAGQVGGGGGGGGGARVAFRVNAAGGQTAQAPTPSAQAPVPSGAAQKVGNGVSAPQLILKTEPQYTEEARTAKYQGTVLVYVEIGTDGYAHNMKVVRGLGLGLDEKAIEAVSQWRFKPGQKNGQPVVVQATIEVNFRLF